jgi:ribulose-phosphate 3-epimerase
MARSGRELAARLMRERRVVPSILSADFARLGTQVDEVLAAGARIIHCDVMDGHFVPPITFGAAIISAIADRVHDAGAMIDVHLMIERPERHVMDIVRAGADNITMHVEATPHLNYTMQLIQEAGCSAGAALSPGTPASSVDELALQGLDLVLCMTVNPGWGNQELIPATLGKLERIRRALPDQVALECDGGVHQQTAAECAQAGANVLVTGSAVFGSADPAAAYTEIATAAGAA